MNEREFLIKLMERKITEILRESFKDEFIHWHFYSVEEEELFYKGQTVRLDIRDYKGFCTIKYYIDGDGSTVSFDLSKVENY